VEWMYAYMAGIRSDGAGFRKIIIEPQLDLRTNMPEGQECINEVNATVATVNGAVKSHWKMDGNNVMYNVSIPSNTTANFILPTNQIGLPTNGLGIKSMTIKENKQYLELGSGNYCFKILIQ
ncbi:MAG: alpha-L-rhamnosidase C-terminal domain-containing protein, partial [Mangrovibacterium sp.]